MSKAKLLADCEARRYQGAETPAKGAVYDDGAIIYLRVDARKQRAIVRSIGKAVIDEARSDDDTVGVIPVTPKCWFRSFDVGNDSVDGFVWGDSRGLDHHTIDLFCDLVRSLS